MVVQHNLTAMNANRMLGLTTRAQAKSTEKLSSGYKINRAADNAAGLSISEKMRKQIRGLTQASNNAQDGISCVQTAEGAMNEVQDMLQRMNELAVQAANGTMSENDRSYIQAEVDQLLEEIDRVSETTKFNETYLLKGDGAGMVERVNNQYELQAEAKKEAEIIFDSSATTTGKTVNAAYKNTVTPGLTLEAVSSEAFESGKSFVSLKINSTTVNSSYTLNYSDADTYYAYGTDGVMGSFDSNTASADLAKYITVDENGNAKLKDGVVLYSDSPDTSGSYGSQINSVALPTIRVEDKLLLDSANNKVALDKLGDYFDSNGLYQGGLFKYDTSASPGLKEIGQEQIGNYITAERATTGLYATKAGVTTAIASTQISDYFEVDSDGKIAAKEGYTIYSASFSDMGVQGTGNANDKYEVKEADFSKYVKTKAGGLTTKDGKEIQESELSNYFDSNGKYNGQLYKDGNQIGAEAISTYLDSLDLVDKKQTIYATIPNADKTGTVKTVEVTNSNVKDFFEMVDGKLAVKDGVQIFSTSDNQIDPLKVDDALVQKLVKATSSSLVDSKGLAVAESDLANYFDPNSVHSDAGIAYKGGLCVFGADGKPVEIGKEDIGKYVKATQEKTTEQGTKALELSFHVGADGTEDNKIKVEIASISAKGLGVANLKVDGKDDTNASAAIDVIGNAIQQVSKQRSALGAIQNRLEHTINNLDNVVENTTSAESAIRDTDMAEEMVSYSKNNILAQAGQAMLAQANQSNQGVLSLLG